MNKNINDQIITASTQIGLLTCENGKNIKIVDTNHNLGSLTNIVYFFARDGQIRKVGESGNWEQRKENYGQASCSTNQKIIKTMDKENWESVDIYALPIKEENHVKRDSVTGEDITISYAPTKSWEQYYDNKLREAGVQQSLSQTNRSKDITIRYNKDYKILLNAFNMDEKQWKKSASAPLRNFFILYQSRAKLPKKELVEMCKESGLI